MYLNKIFILLLITFLVGCGFQPLYSVSDDFLQKTAEIEIEPITGEGGYHSNLYLKNKLNPKQISVDKKYRLKVILQEPVFTNQNIRSDNFASLVNMYVQANYQLTDIQNNQVLIDSFVGTSGLFNIISEPYATIVAQDKLYQNLIQTLSDEIAQHILSYFKGVTRESKTVSN